MNTKVEVVAQNAKRFHFLLNYLFLTILLKEEVLSKLRIKKYFVIYRTFSNIERKKNTPQFLKDTEAISEKNSNNGSAEELESEWQDTIKVSQKRNISACLDAVQDTANVQQDHNKKRNVPRFKRSKIDESRNMDDTFTNISNAVMNFLESTKENTTTDVKTVDQSFVDYIRVHLENIPEPEKSARKKLLFDALIAPLPKTCSFVSHHKREILMKQLLYHLAAMFQ
ncbi:hypothetical protein ALC62_00764 [Cyphomyrmex costatus]|uniref:Uncharacterized protein n=1 Tax=Cyphomyrmex costatus TaxID=456900 RepID=A0A151IQE2_9HYME|nr:hypothetical protein ALC62_00764 [Cyphomyrmex costatus]